MFRLPEFLKSSNFSPTCSSLARSEVILRKVDRVLCGSSIYVVCSPRVPLAVTTRLCSGVYVLWLGNRYGKPIKSTFWPLVLYFLCRTFLCHYNSWESQCWLFIYHDVVNSLSLFSANLCSFSFIVQTAVFPALRRSRLIYLIYEQKCLFSSSCFSWSRFFHGIIYFIHVCAENRTFEAFPWLLYNFGILLAFLYPNGTSFTVGNLTCTVQTFSCHWLILVSCCPFYHPFTVFGCMHFSLCLSDIYLQPDSQENLGLCSQ